MRTLPILMIQVFSPFEPLFSKRVWHHGRVLLAGAILAPDKRTVSSALLTMGLGHHKHSFIATIGCSAELVGQLWRRVAFC